MKNDIFPNMDMDTSNSKDQSQEEDKLWAEFERQYFSVPHPSLITCLKSHVWHCKHICKRAGQVLGMNSLCPSSTDPGIGPTKDDGSDVHKYHKYVDLSPKSVSFPIRMKKNFCGTSVTRNNDQAPVSERLSNVNEHAGSEILRCFDDQNRSVGDRFFGVFDDTFFNPLVSAKHDNKQILPRINSTSTPDAIHLTLYCREDSPCSNEMPSNGCDRSNEGILAVATDHFYLDLIPEILYGPSPVWSKICKPRYKRGIKIDPPYKGCETLVDSPDHYISDPVWETRNDFKYPIISSGSTDLVNYHSMSDATASSKIDYSPSLYSFVASKLPALCENCLGMPKISCNACGSVDASRGLPNISFSNRLQTRDKYQMVYNYLDISRVRNVMNKGESQNSIGESAEPPSHGIKSSNHDVISVLHNYLQTLESLSNTFCSLLERVKNEQRPDYSRWSQIETKMLQNYIEQYNNKMLDSRYTYTNQKQSYDVLRLRLCCPKSSNLPGQWTDHALCSICGYDEDWDDDPILFCDCCYLPMHYCCLGFKPGTMDDTAKHNIRRQRLVKLQREFASTIEYNDDEWFCPSCLFLLDQIFFVEEKTAFTAVRIATGPRNAQQMEILSSETPPWAFQKELDTFKLPYIVGFEYDDPFERIDICKVGKVRCNSISGIATGRLSLREIVNVGNSPLVIILSPFEIPPDYSPFTANVDGCEADFIGRNSRQFYSFSTFSSDLLKASDVLFDDYFRSLLEKEDFAPIVDYLSYMPQEDICASRLIQQHRLVDGNKMLASKKKREVGRMSRMSSSADFVFNNGNSVQISRSPEDDFDRDNIYTLNCKTPLKRLVVSVEATKGVFINLKIPVCIFCGFDAYCLGGGPMKRTSNPGTWGHLKCALALGCTVCPSEIDYSTFVPKVKALKCIICHHWSTAIIQCSHGTCCKAFHVPCAAASPNCLFSWDQNGNSDVLCPVHASGLAPTVVLRKLQSKIQYRCLKKQRNLESSIDFLSPKDDIYSSHFLQPNYRFIATLIERILDLKDRQIFPFPLDGDFVSVDQPQSSNSNVVNIDYDTRESDFNHATNGNGKLSNSHGGVPLDPNEEEHPEKCKIIGDVKGECIWCSLGINKSGHHRRIFDDKTPTADVIGSILFSDFEAIKKECRKIINEEHTPDIGFCDVTSGVLAEIFSEASLVDDKLLKFISDDLIGNKKLISEASCKTYRSSLDGLTRLLNILYCGSESGGDMVRCYKHFISHIKRIQVIDNKRHSFESGSNAAIGIQSALDSSLSGYETVENKLGFDSKKINNLNIFDLLKDLNRPLLMKVDASLLPSTILRMVEPVRQGFGQNGNNIFKDFGICSSCLEFRTNEQSFSSSTQTKRKRTTQAEYFKTCDLCNVVACGDCLFNMQTQNNVHDSKKRYIAEFPVKYENSAYCVRDEQENESDDAIQDPNFICARCEDMNKNPNLPLLCCVLCSRFDGLLVRVSPDNLSFPTHWTCEWNGFAYVHLVCLDWLSLSKQIGKSFRRFPKTMFEHKCHYCGILSGATMQCASVYCNVRFHASCAGMLGCKVDMSKKIEGTSTMRRVFCLRHTFISIGRTGQSERKFLVAPANLYELLAARCYHTKGFFSGVYLSQYCTSSRSRTDGSTKVSCKVASNRKSKHRPKSAESYKQRFNILRNVNYASFGLIAPTTKSGCATQDNILLTDNIARDRLIQAMNYAAMNDMAVAHEKLEKKDIKIIIQMIKTNQLKPIQGSKRGRKPKSLDGSDYDRRLKMPMEDIITFGHSGRLPSGDFFCPVCFSVYFETAPGLPGDDLHWIGCDRCERWFHFVCAGVWAEGILYGNKEDWYCPACSKHFPQ